VTAKWIDLAGLPGAVKNTAQASFKTSPKPAQQILKYKNVNIINNINNTVNSVATVSVNSILVSTWLTLVLFNRHRIQQNAAEP
jgi:hypothetical protein